MTRKDDVLALAAAMRRADEQGHFVVELDAGAVLCLVGAVQLASRHPQARHSFAVRQAVTLVRKLCDGAAARDAEFARFLERGWAEDARDGREGGDG